MVMRRDKGEDGVVQLIRFLALSGTDVVAFDQAQAVIASEAFRQFGKGRHKAGLNLGDLFSYALAKKLDEPLLFKGNDFSQTDIEIA